MTTLATVPDTSHLDSEAHALVTRAHAITISIPEDCTFAAEFLRATKTLLKEIADTFDGPIKAAHAAHKAVIAAKDKHANPVEEAERLVKGKISRYTIEQEQKRRAEEARLREVARKEAEERQLAEAIELERQGHTEAAEQVMAAPVMAPTVVVRSEVPKLQGVSVRKAWTFEIECPELVPREYCSPDSAKIRAAVKANDGKVAIAGVRVFEDSVVSSRTL